MSRPAGFLGEAQWSWIPSAEELGEQIAKFIPRTPAPGIGVRYTVQLLADNHFKLVAERIALGHPTPEDDDLI